MGSKKACICRRLTLLLAVTVSCSEPTVSRADETEEATAGAAGGPSRQDTPGGDVRGSGGFAVEGDTTGAYPGSGDTQAGASGGAGAPYEAKSHDGSQHGVCPTPEEDIFSFFLTSREALVALARNEDGFGGALGGLEGADRLCQTIAESVSSCQKHRVWRAFLSTSTEDAIDRIGPGPWYDRVGRLLANNLQELLQDRPLNADPLIKSDLPNEHGVPNHNPTATPGGEVDNHEILTGSGTDGRKYFQHADTWGLGTACGAEETWSIQAATCWDWTSNRPEGCPRVGHSWPAPMSGANWISVWNEGGCAPGGVLTNDATATGGPDGTRRVGSAGGYGGFYCFGLLGAG